jgi:dCMP deaminase
MKKREDYLNWDEYFMSIAKLTAGRSKDPNTQVGACIVSSDNRVLSCGYNGAPNDFPDELFPWEREGNPLETKYMFVCHAEANAIDNYRGYKKEFEGARIYVDLFPCNECAKKIIQSGIKEVIYLSDKYKDSDSTIASKLMFDTCGVKYRQLDTKKNKDIRISLQPDVVVNYID